MDRKPSQKKILEFNLAVLVQEHREKGPAAKGYKKLDAAISAATTKKDQYLFHMLRHHKETEDGVYLKHELSFRYETDYLVRFYSLLQIAIMAGFAPSKLPAGLRSEITRILGHPAVKKYYTKNYPLLLPQVLLGVAKKNRPQEVIGNAAVFRELLLLDYKVDDDVEAFLFLLDGFHYAGEGIEDLNELLSDRKKITALLKRPRKDETRFEKAFWGFIKYNDYLQQYEKILRKCENETFRSAIWHFRAYWFGNMKHLMKDDLLSGINNIKELVAKTTIEEYKKNFVVKRGIKKKGDPVFDTMANYAQWQKEYKKEVAALKKSIRYNLDNGHSIGLKEYYRGVCGG